MTFQAGQSGNPKGRAKGSLNRNTQLAKLLEPHAEKLVEKMIELALAGDPNALRLCIERLIPKMQYKPTGIDLPVEISSKNLHKITDEIVRAAFDGRISLEDAERLKRLLSDQADNRVSLSIAAIDPVEASRIYQQIMTA